MKVIFIYKMAAVCNFDCICVDSDCKFNHPISIKERKLVRKLFDNIPSPDKNEPNSHLRKANCRFGKLCNNKTCGYRHRLSFADRETLINGFNQSKIDATKTEKQPKVIVAKCFTIQNNNGFTGLTIEEEPSEIPVKVVNNCWADMAEDDDFLMTF
jgi:hypothetical protein